MGAQTNIEWCDHTFNPWRGCTKVSAGCANCYAETHSKRNPSALGQWGPNGNRVVAVPAYWKLPYKWAAHSAIEGARRRVFCASLADWLECWGGFVRIGKAEDNQPAVAWFRIDQGVVRAGQCALGNRRQERPATLDDVRLQLLQTIYETPQLDWLLLTKRPENWETALRAAIRIRVEMVQWLGFTDQTDGLANWLRNWLQGVAAPKNIWVGTSVENQEMAEVRIPLLLKIPARRRFLSCEPLLGPLDLKLCRAATDKDYACHNGDGPIDFVRRAIDWVIVGGESGGGARPFNLDWARGIVAQCKAAGIPAFVKQVGANPRESDECDQCGRKRPEDWEDSLCAWHAMPDPYPTCDGVLRARPLPVIKDRKGGDPNEWPQELRVREFPIGKECEQ